MPCLEEIRLSLTLYKWVIGRPEGSKALKKECRPFLVNPLCRLSRGLFSPSQKSLTS